MIDEATAGDEAMDAHVPERREFLKTGVGFASAVALATFGGGLATAASAASQRGAGGAGRTRRALVINAHQHYPGISEGRLNQTLSRVIRKRLESKGYEVQVTETASGYNIQAEVEEHLWADVIVTQSPVFWFGNPWIYKDTSMRYSLNQGSSAMRPSSSPMSRSDQCQRGRASSIISRHSRPMLQVSDHQVISQGSMWPP